MVVEGQRVAVEALADQGNHPCAGGTVQLQRLAWLGNPTPRVFAANFEEKGEMEDVDQNFVGNFKDKGALWAVSGLLDDS